MGKNGKRSRPAAETKSTSSTTTAETTTGGDGDSDSNDPPTGGYTSTYNKKCWYCDNKDRKNCSYCNWVPHKGHDFEPAAKSKKIQADWQAKRDARKKAEAEAREKAEAAVGGK